MSIKYNQAGNLPIGMAIVACAMALIVFAILLVGFGKTGQRPIESPLPIITPTPSQTPATIDTSKWQSFYSDTYDFELKYPQGWTVFEGDMYGTPVVNVYKVSSMENLNPPLSHHSPGTHVSIFPKGVPTEGVGGDSRSSNVSFDEETKQAIDFTLTDNTPWASYFNLKNPPKSWDAAGFVWLSLAIENMQTACLLSNGTPVPENLHCSDVEGASLKRSGSVNANDRKIEERILSTFRIVRD